MPFKGIKSITLKNFKAFQDQKFEFSENGDKHVLIYGNNGSGKSSLYWALYTFLQSALKDPSESKKYFSPLNNTDFGKESLLNIFVKPNTIPGSLEVDWAGNTSGTVKLSLLDSGPNKSREIVDAAMSTDFVSYRLLQNFYDRSHKFDLDLWPVFWRDILPFLQITGRQGSIRSQIESWAGLRDRWKSRSRGALDQLISDINDQLDIDLKEIQIEANHLLSKHFHIPNEILKIKLEYAFKLNFENFKLFSRQPKNRRTFPYGNIRLSVLVNGEDLTNPLEHSRPQSFLNEARLSKIALSVRLAALTRRVGTVEHKALVLDDLLLSLDMGNRDPILDLILDKYTADYQVIFLTHEKSLFEIMRRKIGFRHPDDWVCYKMIESENPSAIPHKVEKFKTHFELSEEHFAAGKLEDAVTNLRKAAEEFCKKILRASEVISDDYQFIKLHDMIGKSHRFAIQNGLEEAPFIKLEELRQDILNQGPHDITDATLLSTKVKAGLALFENYVNKIKIRLVLATGEVLKFELVDRKSGINWGFEIKLLEPLKLFKEPGKTSIVLRSKIEYQLFKVGIPHLPQPEKDIDSLQHFYDKYYKTSTRTIDPNFWNALIINKSQAPLSSVRSF